MARTHAVVGVCKHVDGHPFQALGLLHKMEALSDAVLYRMGALVARQRRQRAVIDWSLRRGDSA